MYENAEDDLQRILKLVDACPEALRPQAFAILLQGFVDSLGASTPTAAALPPAAAPNRPIAGGQEWAVGIPTDVLPRLKAMAKRRGVAPEGIVALFDFSGDPFTFAPLHVEGATTKERARRVALLVAVRSFLATGRWVADWAEVKAMCTHQNCYDSPNFASSLKQAKGDLFKTVEVGTAVELSATGTDQAEQLVAALANADAAEQ